MFTFSVPRSTALFVGLAVAAAAVTGCADSDITGTAVPETTTESLETTTSTESPEPSGDPVGTATLEVRGGTVPVTIRYSINGAAEQVETVDTLPWTKEYPVYEQVTSYVSVKGTSICAIVMDDHRLVDIGTDDNATCSFAYWG
ncbi:hypothetical protein [Nocardia sp. NPDC051750]|uniref:hypothetical protein n=1 Tax=Nocardia sp. NPDC051750 TaxID=3364325 RepID=UPI0037AE9C17